MAKLTQQQVFEKLQAKGTHTVCEVCAKNQWSVPDADGSAGVIMLGVQPSPSGAFIIGGQSIPAVMNVCTNCGNIRFHALGVVAPEAMRDG